MLKNIIGTTGIIVSQIGLGTVKWGRTTGVKYKTAFTLPEDHALCDLLAIASDCGINLLDTAPAYGVSEERLGKLLKNQRKNWVISTKAGEEWVNDASRFDFSKAGLEASVNRSLRRLHTDYLDIVLVHSNGEDLKLIHEEAVFETLDRLKEAGKIRAFGMSTKTIAGGLATIDQTDLAMVSFNAAYTDERPVLTYANEKNKGIFIKKALSSGHLQAPSLQFALNEPGVTSVIIGTINPTHLRENTAQTELAVKKKQ
ncbi:MAG: aldo/keto reductase [Gammaproteobacteria bacterium RIFCSPHIGHO2_12_FULL_42_10]|nr:MAG: aldo/keto reductase [Gammaproteobacteria bacterium RIFCSPHIGHO2_12_FULL_42_10]